MDADVEPGVTYAGFGLRLGAFLIDSIIVTLLISPLIFLLTGEIALGDYDLASPDEVQRLLRALMLHFATEFSLLGVVFVLFWIARAATPGKLLLGCYIVDAETFDRASTTQLIIRYLGYFPAMLPACLGLLWVAFDPRKQGWHDKLAGTVVVRQRPR